jgi:hypothetical protein
MTIGGVVHVYKSGGSKARGGYRTEREKCNMQYIQLGLRVIVRAQHWGCVWEITEVCIKGADHGRRVSLSNFYGKKK